MSSFTFHNVALRAFAVAVPRHVITADTSDRRTAKFVKQMGVEQVHLSITEQTPLDLGYVALKHALAQVGWQPQQLDCVVFDTQVPDFWGGSGNSSLIHHYLDLREDCATLDLTVGCAAFPYALSVACSILSSSSDVKRLALLIGDCVWYLQGSKAELLANKQHLFGDATGVVLLEKSDFGHTPEIKTKLFAQGHGYINLFAAPSGRDNWHMDADQFVLPTGITVANHQGRVLMHMNGMAIHEFSTGKVVDTIKEHYGAKLQDFDYYVFHQANRQILDAITARLELNPDQVLISFDQYGNTSSCSALTTICHQLHDLDKPARIFNASFGIGLAWGFSELVLEPGTVSAIIETDHHFTEHVLKPVYVQSHAAQSAPAAL